MGGGDYQDVPYSSEHQDAQRIVDHRLVIYGDKLLAYGQGYRMKPAAASSSEYYAFQCTLSFSCLNRMKDKY